ncbi:endonuclease NucS domain-containing protein [Haloarcula nitratireducens]|uniref:Endonuclease NucS n=1 Tax=Haloarcula nitratireducens TaxID=2487749 RepID=A0AAW4PF05_9EURY|nr:endonuclease NucS domain-containing protein [Halomicroarcula nitratireducens]MBX0296946.1 endonuclease NucS [Halomicroarcula nitratireducens]
MIFSVNPDSHDLEHLPEQELSQLNILEREHLEEWAIEEPRILGEDLLVISSEYAKFEDLRERLDILAIDTEGKLVVVELKRDRADRTTDLQAIKYASYSATLTAEEVQKDYRDFWNGRGDNDVSPEEVGEKFVNFLSQNATDDIPYMDDGWANFELDDKPRILLAAGSFGPEITSPVMWLMEEYNMDITCTRIEAYKHQDRVILNSQQVIPIPEAEEYLTKRREKQEKQGKPSVTFTLPALLDRGVLEKGDIVVFDESEVPEDIDREWNPEDDYWRARVTGMTGQQNNIEWLYNSEVYSFTGLTKEILYQLVERDKDNALNGYSYWTHPDFGGRTLLELREDNVERRERRSDEKSGLPFRE